MIENIEDMVKSVKDIIGLEINFCTSMGKRVVINGEKLEKLSSTIAAWANQAGFSLPGILDTYSEEEGITSYTHPVKDGSFKLEVEDKDKFTLHFSSEKLNESFPCQVTKLVF